MSVATLPVPAATPEPDGWIPHGTRQGSQIMRGAAGTYAYLEQADFLPGPHDAYPPGKHRLDVLPRWAQAPNLGAVALDKETGSFEVTHQPSVSDDPGLETVSPNTNILPHTPGNTLTDQPTNNTKL